MAKTRNKTRKSPEVLHRLFNKRVKSLGDTIISLIPTPGSKCRCKGKRCLACISPDKTKAFLIRPTDSSEYRKLLYNCFLVVSESPPPLSSIDYTSRWSQLQIVRNTIKKIMEQCSGNLICAGYDKSTDNSATVERLTSSAWEVLLKRVGDSLMVYLLENTLMFLPLMRNQHIQVSGLSIKSLCFAVLNRESNIDQNRSVNHIGCEKKLKRVNEVHNMSTEQQASSSLESSLLLSSTCIGCSQKQYIAQSNGQRSKGVFHCPSNVVPDAAEDSGNEEVIPCMDQRSSNGTVGSRKKHSHQWRYQRHRNLKSGRLSLDPCREGVLFNFQALQACLCCSAFQSLPNVNEQAQIRRIMLHKMEHCSSVFPRTHILNSLKPIVEGANALFSEIFGNCWAITASNATPCSHSRNICQIKSKCLYHSLTKLLKTLIRNARHCQVSRLLDKHCAVPSYEKDPNGTAYISKGSYSEGNNACRKRNILLNEEVIPEDKLILPDAKSGPTNLYSSHEEVTSFTWAVCSSIIPSNLLGNPSNWRILRRNISRFIRLRKFETFSLKQSMHKLKTSKFPLLYNKHSFCNNVDGTHSVKQKILRYWINWFFSCFVVPLLQAHFYVTESENGKHELFYYRKAIWQEVILETVTRLLKIQNFRYLNNTSLREILKKRSFGYSRARLCPKGTGVRVLGNLKAPSYIKYRKFKSVNSVLQNVHAILKGIQMEQPDKLGSSIFDHNDFYRRFVPFISLLRNRHTSIPKIFIVVADVSKAFDSVNQNKLLEVVKTVLSDDEYMLSKSNKVVCTKKSFYVQPLLIPTPHVGHSKPGILINQGFSITIKKENIFSDLVEHIKHNILLLGGKFYLQAVGIPQGSVVSSLLCSFYYGHMEKNVINPYLEKVCHSHALEELSELHSSNTSTSRGSSTDDVDICNPGYLLLRLIDDYLFISTSEQLASKFYSRLQRGFHDYNAFMNERKFGSNFHVNHKSNHGANKKFVGQDGISFLRWAGLLINSSTLEIQADYSRYLDIPLSSTRTVSWKRQTYQKLRGKLCDFLRPKCHPILYDSNINSPSVVRLNIYQNFLLSAMKFHSYASVLFNLRRLNIKSIFGSLEFSFRYLRKLIRKLNYSLFCATSFRPSFNVEKMEIEFLGLFAYVRVLKKRSCYGTLFYLLESRLKKLPINVNLSPMLKYAIDDVHSSVFWNIKY